MPATTPLTYNGLIAQVALLAPYQTSTVNGVLQGSSIDANFTAVIPQMLTYAEQRIQRDLELLATQSSNSAYHLAAGNPNLNVPPADFVVIQDMSVGGLPLTPVSRAYINSVFPPGSLQSQPRVFAMMGGDYASAGMNSNIILVGPPPDQPYPVTLFGTIRAPSLATYATPAQAGSATTWISTWLPDLLVMACMIYISGYQRDFGRQADDPQMAMSYETQYGTLLASVSKEEYRKRFEADAWSARASSPIATPTRT